MMIDLVKQGDNFLVQCNEFLPVCVCYFQIQAQKVRLARTQGPYYGGSLPNVNQIGRNAADLQVCHRVSWWVL